MGNRVITWFMGSPCAAALHWNGGVESVAAFMVAASEMGWDGGYTTWAPRFMAVATAFMGTDGLTVYAHSVPSQPGGHEDNGAMKWSRAFAVPGAAHPSDLLRGLRLTHYTRDGHTLEHSWQDVMQMCMRHRYWHDKESGERGMLLRAIRSKFAPGVLRAPAPEYAFDAAAA